MRVRREDSRRKVLCVRHGAPRSRPTATTHLSVLVLNLTVLARLERRHDLRRKIHVFLIVQPHPAVNFKRLRWQGEERARGAGGTRGERFLALRSHLRAQFWEIPRNQRRRVQSNVSSVSSRCTQSGGNNACRRQELRRRRRRRSYSPPFCH